MSEVVLLGWTQEQWAEAFGRIPLEEDTVKGMIAVKLKWTKRYAFQPLEVKFVGIQPEQDWDALARVTEDIPWGLR